MQRPQKTVQAGCPCKLGSGKAVTADFAILSIGMLSELSAVLCGIQNRAFCGHRITNRAEPQQMILLCFLSLSLFLLVILERRLNRFLG